MSMTNKIIGINLLFLLMQSQAIACTNLDNPPFILGLKSKISKSGKFLNTSPPIIKKMIFKKAKNAKSLCFYKDTIKLSIKLPEGSDISLEEVGIAFIVLKTNATKPLFYRHIFRVKKARDGNYYIYLRYHFAEKEVDIEFKLFTVSPNLYLSLPSRTYHFRYNGQKAFLTNK